MHWNYKKHLIFILERCDDPGPNWCLIMKSKDLNPLIVFLLCFHLKTFRGEAVITMYAMKTRGKKWKWLILCSSSAPCTWNSCQLTGDCLNHFGFHIIAGWFCLCNIRGKWRNNLNNWPYIWLWSLLSINAGWRFFHPHLPSPSHLFHACATLAQVMLWLSPTLSAPPSSDSSLLYIPLPAAKYGNVGDLWLNLKISHKEAHLFYAALRWHVLWTAVGK